MAPKDTQLSQHHKVITLLLAFLGLAFPLYCNFYNDVSIQVKTSFLFTLALIFGYSLYARKSPMRQSLQYHDFADQRSLSCCVPNTFDVLSNIPFALAGIYGLAKLYQPATSSKLDSVEWWGWFIFAIGVFLVSIGSGYYHWRPNNERLVWDRLPMTIGFMSIFALVIEERVNLSNLSDGWITPPWIFAVCLTLGFASVVYWSIYDDLRPYYFVQGFPIMAIPIMIATFPPQYAGRGQQLMFAVGLYAAAKITESNDKQIFKYTGRTISGHTIKHLLAAWACHVIVSRIGDIRV